MKEENRSARSTSTEDIAVEHPGTGILGEVIGEDDGDESHLINLILKMATSFLLTPNLLQTQQRSRLYAAVHRPGKTYDTPHAPVLPPEPEPKLQPEHVPKYDIVPASSPTPTPALAFKTFPSPFSPLRRTPGRRSGTRCSAHAEQRRGDSDVDWGSSTSAAAGVEDSEEDDNRDMLVDQVIGADAVTAFLLEASSLVHAFRDRDPLHAIGQLQLSVNLFAIAADHTLVLLFVFIGAPQAVPRLVLQVTRPGMRLPDDVPYFERLCGRTVGRPVKDMIREELDQEQEFNDDLDLTRIRTLTSIIARIQSFLGENDDILRAKDRKQRNRIFRAIHNDEFEVVLDDFIDRTPLSRAVSPAHPCASTRVLFLSYRAATAVEPFVLTKKRGNKALEAARQTASSAPVLSLLPMAWHARKLVHELARAFKLNSKSEGNGAARFTKLVETMLSGVRASERNVA
ncbi:hypothetical protein EDB86DRAFT_3075295 [Lactarius hatsudake]|nr:hypothetical protein EDB86DRAFT_3075295 [Lactarius hatsudake]